MSPVGHDACGCAVRLSFGAGIGSVQGQAVELGGPVPRLLHDVTQLMRKQLATTVRTGRVSPRAERNVVAYGIRMSDDRARRVSSSCIGVNANLAEVVREARLHERSRSGVEWLTWRTQDLVHDGR